jgi:choline-sulfatase
MATAARVPERRPNFVFYMPDELRADAVRCVDGLPVRTPHMDRLAAEGTVFTRAFTPHTVCSPSRCSLMTGWYPHTRGHRTLQHLIQPHEPNLLKYLKQAGYHVEWHGKNDLLAVKSFSESVSFRCALRQLPGPPKGEGLDHAGVPTGFRGNPARPQAARGGRGIPWPPDHRYYRTFYYGCRGEGPYQDAESFHVDEALAFLEDRQRAPEAPFFLYLPFGFPHPPYTVEEPYFSLHDRAQVPVPLPARLADKPHFMREMHHAYGIAGLTDDERREIRATYWGMVSRTDAQLGRLLDFLDRSPLRENTVVIVTTDHGDYCGDYGLVEKWWTGFQDCLTRVPVIVRLPDGLGQARGRRVAALAQHFDLFPTIMELAGLEPAHDHFGKSLLPLIRGEAESHRDAVFAEGGHLPHETQGLERLQQPDAIYYEKTRIQHDDPSTVAKACMIRTGRWKYVRRLAGVDELYDLENDPAELANLAAGPLAGEVREVRDSLRARLLDWFLATGDVLSRALDPRG